MKDPHTRSGVPLPRFLLFLALGALACNGAGGGGSPTDPGDSPVAFQGQVVEVDGDALVLVGGLRVIITDSTVFDSQGDLFVLDTIRAALLRGETVTAEGTGERRGSGVLEALEITVETSAAGQPVRFAGSVATLDRNQGVLTLGSGTVLVFDGASSFDPTGDATSFSQLVAAFDRGDLITVEGDGVLRADASIRVTEVLVELDGGAGGATEFSGVVAGVDRPSRRLTLGNGVVVAVDDNTRFDNQGDLRSFDALADAVSAGTTVTVQGEGTFRADGSILAERLQADT